MEKPEAVEILDDGFGNKWEKCSATCALEIVRPGKVQCTAEGCPFNIDSLQFSTGEQS